MLRRLAKIALQAVRPETMLRSVRLPTARRYYVIGAGKATYGMTLGLHRRLGKRIVGGYINVPVVYRQQIGAIKVQPATHPFPNATTITASRRILQLVQSLNQDDVVIGLWSGGGSSLFEIPRPGLALQHYTSLMQRLMQSGANIVELNTVRKHLSQVKGGQLAMQTQASVMSYLISDVIGDRLDMIASGPTVADTSTVRQARQILKKYHLLTAQLATIIAPETPKKLNSKKIKNTLIGSNRLALAAVSSSAKPYHPKILTTTLQGEARVVAKQLVQRAKRIKRKPALLLAGGETTVTVRGPGYGGRNQELALAALPYLTPGMSLLALATDGVDGFTPKPVAGAMVRYGQHLPDIERYLQHNDSYTALKKLGSLIHTGPTGTNVGDIVMILVT